MLVVLPDGGELEEPDDAEICAVGDHGLPSPVIYRHPGSKDQPALQLRLEIWNGVPVCAEVTLAAKQHDQIHVRAKDLKLVASQLENIIEYWMSYLAYMPAAARPGRRGWVRSSPQPLLQRKAAITSVRAARKEIRRKMTDELLQKVADTHNSAAGARIEAVARAFGVSPRTAQRYIEKARDAGLLAPATRGSEG